MKYLEEVELKLQKAINELGVKEFVNLSFSDRPELSDFQTNISFSLAKTLKRPPIIIAQEICEKINSDKYDCFAVAPGFINIKLKDEYFNEIFKKLFFDERIGIEKLANKKIVFDYGGPNVAKPLHVGHLRSAIIGETLKRLGKLMGLNIISDIHLGDYGLQMGLTIAKILEEYDCEYFFTGKGVKPKIDAKDLELLYPRASEKSKTDEQFKKLAQDITVKLQNKEKGYFNIWQEIKEISIKDIKKIYTILNVNFDKWYGESDSQKYISKVFNELNEKKLIEKSDGAEIIRIEKVTDKSPMPPVIIKSSAGANLYSTTELATIFSRIEEFSPDEIWYLTDNRQSMHFNQIFRVCEKLGLNKNLKLKHIAFGTVNGEDGKPFKTRQGSVMKLEDLIKLVENACKEKLIENDKDLKECEINELAKKIGIAAIKFGDLINYPEKDYIFDIPKFCSFEGKTGPYMLYSVVRINSILKKANNYYEPSFSINTNEERNVILCIIKFIQDLKSALLGYAPNIFVQSAYNLACAFSTLYSSINILTNTNLEKKNSLLTLINLVKRALEIFCELLGLDVPEKM